MGRIGSISFLARIGICMLLSTVMNLLLGYQLRSKLTQTNYKLRVEVDYDAPSTMELHFDTNANFNSEQEVIVDVSKGNNKLRIPFQLQDGQQLKFLRLDFGNETELSKVRLHNMVLSISDNVLFDLNGKQLSKHIGLLQGMEQNDKTASIFHLDTQKTPFDPYLVFSPLNELMMPLWKRTLFLILPWLLLFFLPVLNWVRQEIREKRFALILAALFLASIPLKIAWVSFTALLLLAFAFFELAKKRSIKFASNHLAVILLFAIPLFFMGKGEFSKLAIPLGFLIFPVVCAVVAFSGFTDEIKKIFTRIFFVFMSITITSFILLVLDSGYFYGIDLANYFQDVKPNAHSVLYWLFYDHPTFLSFFILIGGIFCYDLWQRRKLSGRYALLYVLFSILALALLGSRFTLLLGFMLPVLFTFSLKSLKRLVLPLWIASFAAIVYFIDDLDGLRARLWELSWNEIKVNLWFGHGTGTSDALLPDYFPIQMAGRETLMEINHSHNQFLTYLLENGLLGTILFVVLMLFLFFRFAKQENKTMVLVIFALLMLMIVESPFKTSTPLYLISFLLTVFSDTKSKPVVE